MENVRQEAPPTSFCASYRDPGVYSDVLFSLMTAGWAEHGGYGELSDRPTLSEQQKHIYSLRGEIKVTVLTHPKAGTCGFIIE